MNRLIRFLVLSLTILVFPFVNYAEKVTYSGSWGKQGFTVESAEKTSVRVNYSLEEFFIDDITIGDKTMKTIHVPGIFLPNDEGAPDLPGTGRYIAIPQGAEVSYKIIALRKEIIKNVDIAPAPRIPFDNETGPLQYEKNDKIYSKDAFYPEKPVIVSNGSKIRGVDVVMLGITPFQYNPVTKELIVYRDLKVEIEFKGGNGHFGDDRLRSRWWDPIVKDAVLNPDVLPAIDFNIKNGPTETPDFEYIIICPNDPVFISWADSIKTFRTLQGINTGVVTTADIGGNTTTAIENYINNAYNSWAVPPSAVLLLGDYGTSGSTIISPIYNSYCVSDNIYADVDGDQLPDVVLARMTAQNASHLQTMITKFLNYERTPPTDPNFYDHPITALGWQTSRWFQICSETVGGFWHNELGKNPVRINAVYSGNPSSDPWSTATNTSTVVDYFGPSGLGYIPATPQELGGFSGGTATDVANAINNGAFALQHRDHGAETGWGEPSFSSSNIDNLTNTDLPWIFSINCLTGKYNISGECFAEKFHRYTFGGHNSGALGITAASEVSYSFVNDTYVWGMYDNMWTDFLPDYGTNPASRGILPAFGNAAGKYFLAQSSWPYNTSNKEVTYHLFHHHGDAFTVLYSEVPQYLTVNHASSLLSGATSFVVTANAGSFIALTVNGVILATADGTGSPVTLSIPPQNVGDVMIVTVTKQNYYRYSASVNVVPPSGPYVVYNNHIIDDAAGNNNGEADFGENIVLDMTLENVGSNAANNVVATLVCTDSYITLNDISENYGSIAAGSNATVNGAFSFSVANDVPDQHTVNFELQVTGTSDDTWSSSFTVTVNAPVLEAGDITIDDAAGGNGDGRLDPGETVDVIIETSNTGHSDSPQANATLACASPYITINSANYALGTIAEGATVTATFNISVSPSTPNGTSVIFSYAATAGNYSVSQTYTEVAGQIPVLIINLDGNNNSAPEMETALDDLMVSYETLSAIPSSAGDLALYKSVFLCLGIYSSNHVLTSSEGQVLADYLNNGGYLYMEGGDTWAYDSQTAVHSMFNIDGQADGSSDMSTIAGQSSTFTDGMSFSYSGDNSWMDHLGAIAPAYLILENQSPVYGTGVAYDAGTYKTIGVSHEFGGLTDGTLPSTKKELMNQYLTFFGIAGTPLQPPDIDVTPGSFYVTLATDETKTETMTITNSGEIALDFSIEINNVTSKGGKMPQNLTPEQRHSLRGKEYFGNDDELEPGGFFPQNWVMPPINKYGDSKGEETFGSWNGGTYSGGTRDRGNIYHITTERLLTEFRFYLNISSSTELYFAVYEGTSLTGLFTKIAENYISNSGTGEGWYSSGPMSVLLESGKYYYLCTSWNATATYGRGTETVPLPTSFGTLETGIPGTQAGFPPATSFTNNYSGTVPYYQTVVTEDPGAQWLSTNPNSGNVSSLSSYDVDVFFDATGLSEGEYIKNIVISSNDPDEPQVVVPCTLEVYNGIKIDLKAFLEGPFSGTEMSTDLNSGGYLPLNQPYNVSPWNYNGTESVLSIPNSDVVDWVLVELRETAGGAATATPAAIVGRKAGFILKNGSIVTLDGTTPLRFGITVNNNLFAVVYHRNHSGIMSANPLTLSGDQYVYDFSSSEAQVFGGTNAHRELAPGIWGLFAGDGNGDGEVDNKDKDDVWTIQLGTAGYLQGDFDLNGQVENDDETLLWEENAGKASQIVK